MRIFIFILGVAAVAFSAKVRYDNYKVYRFTPTTEDHVKVLLELENQGVSFWHGPSKDIGKPSDVMFPPHLQGQLLEGVIASGIKVEEYIEDIQKLIDDEVVTNLHANGELDWTSYHLLEDIYSWLDAQAAAHSSIASTFVLGQTFEGRDLKAIKISKSGETKPAIFLDSNIHAREWITSAVSTYLINELLNSNDPRIQSWTEDFDWYVLPVFNPDGFSYTHTNERMWRKTRSNTSSPLGCKGADPNRNFDYFWFTGGSSSNPCSDTHAGPRAFSEPETFAMSQFIDTIAHRMPFYISLHSYGQWILIPHGHNNNRIPQYNTYMRIGNAASQAHRRRNGTIFTPGNVVDLLYVASGESFDWVKGKHNTNLTYIYELRDQGRYGFILPPSQIIDSAIEFMDGLQVIIDELRAGIPESDAADQKRLASKLPPNFVRPVTVPKEKPTNKLPVITAQDSPKIRKILSTMPGFQNRH